MNISKKIIMFLFVFALLIGQATSWACTTMIVGKDATADGSVIVAHSDDDVDDERVAYVPAADHKPGSMRAVYYDNCSLGFDPKYNSTVVRRYIGTDRGPVYDTKDYAPSKPIGYIPQVAHTYAYFDSNYGMMNEHQLMIGECTCGAKVEPKPEPGKRIFYSAELSRVALERCTSAREAIKLIGKLIKEYGYYGTGETLLIGDPREGWVLEMCAYDMDGKDGIWVARRVPDNGLFVEANEFRIREVKKNSPDTMYSDNLFKVCREKGWWNPKEGELDWLKAVSWGEYGHPYYSLRRVWGVFRKANRSLKLPAWVEDGYTKAYPFTVVPDKKLTVADVISLYRDHYEGTEFDMTKGISAGPFGNPTRFEKNPDEGDTTNLNVYKPKGAWERSLSIYRCGESWISQGRSWLPDPVGGICWIGLDRPATTCLIPIYAGVNELPRSFETMNVLKFSRRSAWWAFNFVANYAAIKYSYMIKDIEAEQKELEGRAYAMRPAVDQAALTLYKNGNEKLCREYLTSFCRTNAEQVISQWWKLSGNLIVKYNNGCITTEKEVMKLVGYPEWWLKTAGYYKGPISYKKP